MRLLVIRHGQTAWNAEGRAQGHTDISLDETGLHQARLLAASLDDMPLRRVVTSDLSRSRETAQLVADRLGLELIVEPRFRESCIGEFEGRHYTEYRAEIARLAGVHQAPWYGVSVGGGECGRDVWKRVCEALEDHVPGDGADTAIIAHGGSCSMIAARLIGGTVDTSRSIRFGNTAVAEFQRMPAGHWVIQRYNDTRHLDQPSSPMIDLHASAS
ncbi:MAG: putative phosphoserine phosphatase 2 [Fimbriimonadaceae bacterium]|nr:putative phosphoserine phosphatase 2 [Fimbriimonadaceae bacterium]